MSHALTLGAGFFLGVLSCYAVVCVAIARLDTRPPSSPER